MRLRRGQLLTVTIGCASLALLVACTSGGGGSTDTPTLPPPTSPSPSRTSPSSTPSPTGPLTTGPNVRPGEQPPTLKVLAKRHDSLGALSIARYYLLAKDWSIATDDTFLLEQIVTRTCQTCKRWIGIVSGYAKQGAYAKGGRLTIGECKIASGTWDVKSDYVVDCKFTQAPVSVVYKSGPPSTQASTPTAQGSFVFVSWIAGKWKIVEEEDDS